MLTLLQNFSYVFLMIVLSVYVRNTFQKVPLPVFIHTCGDPIDECFAKAALDAIPGFVKGIPDAEISPMDPLYMDMIIKVDLPDNVKMTFHNRELSGLGTWLPDKASSHRKNHTFILNMHCNFTIKGQYTIVGKILLFNLDTNGDTKIKISNQNIRLEVLLKKLKRNDKGEGHYEIKSYTYKADYGTDVDLNLNNLYSEYSTISLNILKVLNSNSQLLVNKLEGPILDYAIDNGINAIQKLFDTYTYDQLKKVPLTEDSFENE